GEVPQADGLPEQPNQPASTHQQSCGADQPYVSLLGEGAVQVAASKDAGPVRGPDTRRRLERLGTPNGTRGRSLKNRQTRQDATPSQTSTTSSRVIIWWRSLRSLKDPGVIPLDFRPLWLEFLGPHARKGITMSELRNRMIQDMQLAGLVEGTRREYLRAARQLAAYYMISPDRLSERNVEDYLLYVRDDLGVA